MVGGAAVTEEFCPGFRNSVASYTVSLLNPKVIDDLALRAHGLRIVEREIQNFLPLPDGRLSEVRRRAHQGGGGEIFWRAMRSGSTNISKRLDAIADVLRAVVLETPPDAAAEGWRVLPELLKAAPVARRLGKLGAEMRRELLDLFLKSAGDFLELVVRERSDQGALRF